jgi:hypothetical protein
MNTLEHPSYVPNSGVMGFVKGCNMVVTPPGTVWPSEIVEALKEGFACEQCSRVAFGQLAANRRGLFMLRLSEWCSDDSCVVNMALQASNSMKLPLFLVLIPYSEVLEQTTNKAPIFAPFLRFTPDDCWISSFSFSPQDMHQSVRTKIAIFNSSPKRVIHTRDGFCVLMVDLGGSNSETCGPSDQNTVDPPVPNAGYINNQNTCDNMFTTQDGQTAFSQAANISFTEDKSIAYYSDSKAQTTCDIFSLETRQDTNTSLTFDQTQNNNDISFAINSVPSYEGTYFEGTNDEHADSTKLDQQGLEGLISSFDPADNVQETDTLNIDEVLREIEANNEPNNNDDMNYSTQPNSQCNTTMFENEQTQPTGNTSNDETDSTLMKEYTDYEAYMHSQQPEQASNHSEAINDTWTTNPDFIESTNVYDLLETTDVSQFGLPTPSPEFEPTDLQNNTSTTLQTTTNGSNGSLISPPLEEVLNNQLKHTSPPTLNVQ